VFKPCESKVGLENLASYQAGDPGIFTFNFLLFINNGINLPKPIYIKSALKYIHLVFEGSSSNSGVR
jgi:hypothetical protein